MIKLLLLGHGNPVKLVIDSLNKNAFEVINVEQDRLRSGKEVEAFEQEFASYCGSKYCIGVANGLDALILILTAYKEMGIMQEGDEVIMPANTYIATILAISKSNLKPILIEPDIITFNIDPSKIESNISKKTRAIMPVHLYGQCADMESINTIAHKYNLKVIEDAAQEHGATYKGKKPDALVMPQDLVFIPGKTLARQGIGGAVTTNDDSLANVVKALRNYGSHKKYYNVYKGVNSRLDEIYVAILQVKFGYLDKENGKRNELFYLKVSFC